MSRRKSHLSKTTLVIYWKHARAYLPMVVLCIVGMTVFIGSDLALPVLYKRFFDQLAVGLGQMSSLNLTEIYRTMIFVGVTMTLSWIGYCVSLGAITRFESFTMRDLYDSSFKYLQNHSHRFFTENFAGALVKRVNRFVGGFEAMADQCTLEMGQAIVRIILIIGVIFWFQGSLGFIFFAWTIVFTIFNFCFSRWKLKFDIARAEKDTKVTAYLSDTIANTINLKLFAGTNREIKGFKEVTEEHHQARYKTWMLGLYSDCFQGLSVRILEMGVVLIALRYWRMGMITIGDFVLLRTYLVQLNDQVRAIGRNVRRIYEVMADSNEMTEILCTPHEIVDVAHTQTLSVSKGRITFADVQFAYGSRPILSSFRLITEPGERIGIVGPSGGGKSTILKLLVRLHDVTGGEILIDGQDIARVTQDSLHQAIACVPQEPTLFHRTLMENIRYARPNASDAEVIEAAKLAHCHEFISTFSLGYETLVGERGVKLSGGERQRIAIARAILMDAPILILDEATSSLDSESELFIQDSLSRLMVGRTVIAVAHRLSTVRKMDRIVVVKDGRIIEEGHHDILVKAERGHYRKLWSLQSSASA